MTDDKPKAAPREWWIQWVESGMLEPFWDVRQSKPFPSAAMKYTHVIEYSYAQALEEKLRVAIEALEAIAVHFGTDYCSGDTMIAHEALKKIDDSGVLTDEMGD